MGDRDGSAVDRMRAFFLCRCNSSLYKQDPGKNVLIRCSSRPHLSVTQVFPVFFFIATLHLKFQAYMEVERKNNDSQTLYADQGSFFKVYFY